MTMLWEGASRSSAICRCRARSRDGYRNFSSNLAPPSFDRGAQGGSDADVGGRTHARNANHIAASRRRTPAEVKPTGDGRSPGFAGLCSGRTFPVSQWFRSAELAADSCGGSAGICVPDFPIVPVRKPSPADSKRWTHAESQRVASERAPSRLTGAPLCKDRR